MTTQTTNEQALSQKLVHYWRTMNLIYDLSADMSQINQPETVYQTCLGYAVKFTDADEGWCVVTSGNGHFDLICLPGKSAISLTQRECSELLSEIELKGYISISGEDLQYQQSLGLTEPGCNAFLLIQIVRKPSLPSLILLQKRSKQGEVPLFTGEERSVVQLITHITGSTVLLITTKEREIALWRRLSGEIANRIADPLALTKYWLDELKSNLGADTVTENQGSFKKIEEFLKEIDGAVEHGFRTSTSLINHRTEKTNLVILLQTAISELPWTRRDQIKLVRGSYTIPPILSIDRTNLQFAIRELLIILIGLTSDEITLQLYEATDHSGFTIKVTAPQCNLDPTVIDPAILFDPAYYLLYMKMNYPGSLHLVHKIITDITGAPPEILIANGTLKLAFFLTRSQG